VGTLKNAPCSSSAAAVDGGDTVDEDELSAFAAAAAGFGDKQSGQEESGVWRGARMSEAPRNERRVCEVAGGFGAVAGAAGGVLLEPGMAGLAEYEKV
jgi:hypothetical protein